MKQQKTASTTLDPKILLAAIKSAIVELDPRLRIKNPVMCVVEIVAALTTVIGGRPAQARRSVVMAFPSATAPFGPLTSR